MGQRALHLWGQSPDDLEAISALCQDAILRTDETGFDQGAHRFVLMLNRFRWETPERPERVRSALRFETVLRAQHKAWPGPTVPGGDPPVLSLLAVTAQALENGHFVLTLAFSGKATARLEVECIDAMLEDISLPWPAKSRPKHK